MPQKRLTVFNVREVISLRESTFTLFQKLFTQFPKSRVTIFIFIVIIYGEGCTPKTRRSETEKAIPLAVMVLMMERQQREFYLAQITGEPLEHLQSALKMIEQTTREIEFKDQLFGKEIDITMNVKNGTIVSLFGEYSNGVKAKEYHNVNNGITLDSTIRFYPDGKLYSRRVNSVDSTQSIYDEFHQNGKLRNRRRDGILYTWFETGSLSGMYSFTDNQVGQRKTWHANGKMREVSTWLNDTMHGQYYEWDSTGRLIRDMIFVKGKDVPKR